MMNQRPNLGSEGRGVNVGFWVFMPIKAQDGLPSCDLADGKRESQLPGTGKVVVAAALSAPPVRT